MAATLNSPREWKYSRVSAGPVWKMSRAPDVVIDEL